MAPFWLTKAIRLPSGDHAPSVTVSFDNVNAAGVPPLKLIVFVPFVALSPIESPAWLADAPLIATMVIAVPTATAAAAAQPVRRRPNDKPENNAAPDLRADDPVRAGTSDMGGAG
jgi:hypothetical protein